MSKPIRKIIHPEVRIIDAAKGVCDYVASDETVDCYQEVIKADGWRFTNFSKNSPFVDSHNYDCIDRLLGQVIDYRVDGDKLIERVQWAVDIAEQPLAMLGWKMTVAGYLKAVSVGFFPKREVSRWDSDPKGFNDALNGLLLPSDVARQIRCIYLEQEQIELSACIIGANPNALAKAHKDGAVTDGDLAGIGLDDDDFEHLGRCLEEDCSPAVRRLIAINLQLSIKLFRNEKNQAQQATRADTAAEAREAARRQREAFVAEIKKYTS